MSKLLFILFSVLLLSSCSKTSTPTSSNTTTPIAGSEQIIANIGGTDMTFRASARTGVSGTYDSLSIFGIDTVGGKNYKIAITSSNITKANTYDVKTLPLPTAFPAVGIQFSSVNVDGSNSMIYDSEQSINKKLGTITYTSLTPLLVQGTFSATLPQVTSACGGGSTITIINGSFKIVFA